MCVCFFVLFFHSISFLSFFSNTLSLSVYLFLPPPKVMCDEPQNSSFEFYFEKKFSFFLLHTFPLALSISFVLVYGGNTIKKVSQSHTHTHTHTHKHTSIDVQCVAADEFESGTQQMQQRICSALVREIPLKCANFSKLVGQSDNVTHIFCQGKTRATFESQMYSLNFEFCFSSTNYLKK